MRIAEFTAFHARIPLKRTIRHASHTRSENDTLIVRCRLADGTEGWGESLPRPYVTGETIETAFEQLRQTDFNSQLGESFDNLRTAIPLCDRFQPAACGHQDRDCFGNAARCAVELSILDAVARLEGVPLSSVTRMIPETIAIRHLQDRVRYSAAITPMGAMREMIRACMVRLCGFHQSKVKVAVDGIDDVAALKRIRRIVGANIDLRIDANEAWTCGNLESKLQPLLPFGISSVEQPVSHAEVSGLAEIRKRIETPLMLDESLCSLGDAYRAIEQGTCDLFNIRLSKCGGFLNSLRLAALAHKAGLGYQLGCQVGETGILSAAGRHFASSVGEIRYLEGSFDRFLVKEPLTVEDISFGYGGYAPALTGPGLGIRIDSRALSRVTVAEEHWNIR